MSGRTFHVAESLVVCALPVTSRVLLYNWNIPVGGAMMLQVWDHLPQDQNQGYHLEVECGKYWLQSEIKNSP